MKTGFLQLQAGIAGDMLLGALLDAGADLGRVNAAVAAVSDGRLEITVHPTDRAGLRGLRAHVRLDGAAVAAAGGPAHHHEHSHTHHHHVHEHLHKHELEHEHSHDHRGWAEIDARLQAATLSDRTREGARAVFRRLAEVEGARHGVPPEAVHFHEVGGWDALADIVGVSAALESLAVGDLWHGAVAVGGGTVRAAHGVLPVPAPATLELLGDRACVFEEGAGELTTPTGAPLLCVLPRPPPARFARPPVAVGYGAGRADSPGRPNLVRFTLGEAAAAGARAGTVCVLETAIDNLTPEDAGDLVQHLLDRGALDATLTPLVMKKSRPGFLLRVVAAPESEHALLGVLWQRTATLGVRVRNEERHELPRTVTTITVDGETLRLKVAELPDGSHRAYPELDDLVRVATRTGESLAGLRMRVLAAWQERR